MNNEELLPNINKHIAECKKYIKDINVVKAEMEIKEIESLIDKYEITNDRYTKIIKENRIDDLKDCKEGLSNLRKEIDNTLYGKVKRVNFEECGEWITSNNNKIQKEINRIKVFNNMFPIKNNKIIGLSLNKYVYGKGKETFCWYLQKATPGNMGNIRQGASSYSIYLGKENNKYISKDGNTKIETPENEATAIFNSLKKDLETMLVYASEKGKIKDIEEGRKGLRLPTSNVLMKILFLYYPEQFIGYYAKDYVRKIAAMIGLEYYIDVFQSNNMIAEKVKKEMSGLGLSDVELTVGFTIYLFNEWNDYIKEDVNRNRNNL